MQILSVCTGNICRSPLAESILRSRLDSDQFKVTSAGVRAMVGGRVPREQLLIAAELGLTDLPGHVGQQLSEQMVEEADLILVANRKHRATVVQMVPRVAGRTFTYREFAHLARTVTKEDIEDLVASGDQRMHAAVAAVAQQRGAVPPLDDYDVTDPYGRDAETYRLSAKQMVPAIEDASKYLRIVSRLELEPVTYPVPELALEGSEL